MRKVMLAIMLMGAAFAGGAVVNGPGLNWIHEHVLAKSDEEGDAAVPESNPQAIEAGIPSAPVASLVTEVPPQDRPKAQPKQVAQETAKSADPGPPAEREKPESAPRTPAAVALADPPAPAPVAALPPLEAPVDAEAPRPAPKEAGQVGESLAPRGRDMPPATNSRPQPALGATGPWADAPDSGPAGAVPPKGYQKPVEADTAVAQAVAPGGDWAALRRRMQALGIARYGFEGETNGRVRFHCVIPLAGRRAVGQQFEAEGDDEFQAAQLALRRVALWQATENR